MKKIAFFLILLCAGMNVLFAQIAAPTLNSPSDGYVYPNTVKPLLKINSVSGASYYLFHWSEDPTFATYSSHTMSSSYTGLNVNGLKFGTTYYWRVYAITANYADTSAVSEVWSFTTTNAPTLTSPSDGTILSNSVRPNIRWTEITGASKYIYQCDTSSSFNSPLCLTYTYTGYSSSGSNPNQLHFGKTYYVRMKATNTNESDTSAWSEARSFTTSDAPTLTSPSDGAILSNSVRPNIRWTEITGASQYIYQCDTSSSFNSPLCLTYTYTGYNSSGSNPNQLHFGKTYYVRMKATNSDGSDTSSWSAARSFTTTDAPTLSSPSNGSTLTSVAPTVYYNTITGASGYQIQWSEDPDFATHEEYSLGSSNNGYTLNRLKFGTTYYWRIRSTNSDNSDTSSWSEVWHFTTTNGVPTLSSPSNGSTSTVIRPTLYYNTISGAGGYLMQWGEDPDFATYEESSLSSSNNGLTLNRLKFATTYYWRVCAINNNSTDTSAWSEVWHFTTTNGIPTLSSPSNGSTSTVIRPTLYYNTISGAGGYLMQWGEDPDFATYEESSLSSSNNGLTLNRLKFSTTYYWRVCALNNNSTDTSAWSEVWHFTTTNGIPTLSSPTNGSTLTIIKPTAYYNTISGAGGYLMQWSEDADFATYEEYSLSSSNNGLNLNRLKFATTYYWRVCSINNNSTDTSAWSEVWSFTTCGAPTLSSPSDGYVYSSSVTPTLQCTSLSGVGKYIFEWDTTATFSSPLCGSTVKTTYSTSIGPLKLGTTYYWHARITNSDDSDTSSWSAVWSFTTGGSIPTLASPSNGATAVRLRPTLDWNAVSSCDYYDYECDTTPQFNSPELQSGAIAAGTSEVRLNQLRYGTTYYWRVRIRLNSDTSSWSTVWSFTTAGTIALTSPSNGTTLYRYLHPTLDWDFINDGDYYEYQYDLSPDFDSPELVSGLVAVGTSEVDLTAPMRFGTTYYWRVREYTSIDTTPWSATWSFTTPGEIALVSPANGSTLSRTLNPTLDWDYINGGDTYEYQYDLSPDFNSPELVTGQRAVGTSEIDITTPLRFGATYYWRVRETTSIDTTPWSETWSFTTPGEVVLVSPANGTTNVGSSTTLDWDYIRGGTIYEYQYDVTPAFNSAELVEGSIQVGTSQVTISNLEENRLYYWRVRELSAVDTTPWSEVWHFSTRMQPIFTDVYDTACDSYTWNGQTYTQSGEYTHQFVTALQADSTVTLHLTIYQSVTSTSSVTVCESDLPYHYVNGDIDTTFGIGTPNLSTFNFQFSTSHGCDSTVILTLNIRSANHTDFADNACGSYTWNNEVYEESGDYVQTFTNAAGCDSVVTLHLTIFTADYAEFAETACGSYTWNGEVYEESGDYVQTFTNANGCDSVVTLHLTIFTADYADFADNACGSYTWNGEVYEESGDYVQTFTNASGCDSTVTLHLTIYEPATETVEVTICENDLPYHYVNGDIDTTFGIGTPNLSTSNFQFSTSHGCDSVITLHLTINQPVVNETYMTACDEYEWNGETLTASGDYTATFTAANGCDSTVTLHLTIYPSVTSTSSVTVCENDLPYHYVNGDIDTTFEVGTPNLSVFNFQFSTSHGCDSIVTLTLTITTGVNEWGNGHFTLYPNPTTGMVNVQFTMNNKQWENAEIQVFDVYGRLLQTVETLRATSLQIDLSQYTPGVYLVRVVNGGKVMAVRKVVKE